MQHYLISMTVFFPLLGACLQAFLPTQRNRWIALVASIAASVCALILVISMQTQVSELQAIEILPWVEAYAITYNMGIDGLNVLLVLLIALLFPVLIASELDQKVGARGMHGLFLILQTALFGAVCAQDLFLQFFFWSLSALPFYFLVGIWGGQEREKAAFRVVVASTVGNALIFAALILVYYSVEPHSFSLQELAGGKLVGKELNCFGYRLAVSSVAFLLMSAGLSLRAPIWPFHGWFTEVAQEAPFSVLIALAAGVVPVAMYLLIRISYLLFPETLSATVEMMMGIGMLNLLMGGICALAQKGLRRLLAFICLSEVGLILMGISSLSSAGIVGAVYQILMTGLGLAGFGLFSGVISERTGETLFLTQKGKKFFGGIATDAPMLSVVAGVVIASLVGFPGFAGFVGHALIVIGSFKMNPLTVLVIGIALLLAAYYLFNMYRYIFLGTPFHAGPRVEVTASEEHLHASHPSRFEDLTFRERMYLFPMMMGILFFGLYPKPFIELIRPTVLTLLSVVK